MLKRVVKRASLMMRRTKIPSRRGGREEIGERERVVRRVMRRVKIEASSKKRSGVEEWGMRACEMA